MEKEDNDGKEEHLLMNPSDMEKDDETSNKSKENKEKNEKKEEDNNKKEEKEENKKDEEGLENEIQKKIYEDDNNDEIAGFKNEPEEIKIERLKGDTNTYDRSIKVILIGDSGVGKTNILSRLVNNKFEEKHNPSLSLEYNNHTIKINNFVIRMQIWDTAGQEKLNSIISNYYRSAEVAVFVYSINNKNSYISIQEWFKELINENNEEDNNVKKVLLGNKLDLEKNREVEYKAAKTFADENGFEVFAEITCKNDDQQKLYNIGNIFDAIGKLFYDEFSQSRDTVMTMSSFHYIASNSILESKRNTETESKQPEKKDGGCCICLCF
jgi:small GTP-binding protein